MKREQRMSRIREILIELDEHLEALDYESEESGRETSTLEKVDVHAQPGPGGSFPLDFGHSSDLAIAQFMTCVTPLAVPTELGAARALFEQLAGEAEYMGQRQSGGHLWAIRVVDNGRYELWTDAQGQVERVDYRGL